MHQSHRHQDCDVQEVQFFQIAVGAAVFYSLYEDDRYQEQMGEWFPNPFIQDPKSTATSCSGFACSSHSDDSGGGDSGDSSCSSCGGGCSS